MVCSFKLLNSTGGDKEIKLPFCKCFTTREKSEMIPYTENSNENDIKH